MAIFDSINSINPDQPNAAGIAAILNKESTNVEGIPGRALLMSHPWHKKEILTSLTLYAPNDSATSLASFLDFVRFYHIPFILDIVLNLALPVRFFI